MPPHCDSLDGPVVSAARQALEADDVELVPPFVPEDGEPEVRAMFAAVQSVRTLSEDAREVADRLFFEWSASTEPGRAPRSPGYSRPVSTSAP